MWNGLTTLLFGSSPSAENDTGALSLLDDEQELTIQPIRDSDWLLVEREVAQVLPDEELSQEEEHECSREKSPARSAADSIASSDPTMLGASVPTRRPLPPHYTPRVNPCRTPVGVLANNRAVGVINPAGVVATRRVSRNAARCANRVQGKFNKRPQCYHLDIRNTHRNLC